MLCDIKLLNIFLFVIYMFLGDAVHVTVGLWVLSVDSINVVDMVRTFDLLTD